ncbi:hypothetical protein BDZ91DRAFT_97309 [Kalaharituber pfeilii]|nr:hypothetical protein BDZ91DRAFT_97309 [Kalaharituber pfeilii]
MLHASSARGGATTLARQDFHILSIKCGIHSRPALAPLAYRTRAAVELTSSAAVAYPLASNRVLICVRCVLSGARLASRWLEARLTGWAQDLAAGAYSASQLSSPPRNHPANTETITGRTASGWHLRALIRCLGARIYVSASLMLFDCTGLTRSDGRGKDLPPLILSLSCDNEANLLLVVTSVSLALSGPQPQRLPSLDQR